ncbi:MAG: hypothetical protein JGK13_29280 [Microcoleus sp. PH2017_37_MFU_D_B]|uniref:hypothetical protein n=1 Tax=Microcoleus sp. PH2017_37_MFU_D_B TaxID=2798847 RepID=UPI001E15EBA9|nr:hypothetical protein [Microcoleus sp. PH2017_37_MFU_D_B]MCC3638404.1 hypothetical protein [Microcoleus sp. PH2017_37_MFU_D_B]
MNSLILIYGLRSQLKIGNSDRTIGGKGQGTIACEHKTWRPKLNLPGASGARKRAKHDRI